MERKDEKHGYNLQDEEKYLSNSWSLNGVLVGEMQYSMRSICETTCDNGIAFVAIAFLQ